MVEQAGGSLSNDVAARQAPTLTQPATEDVAAGVPGREPSPGQPRDPFVADRADGIFALIAFVLGFFFIRWVFFSWRGWGGALFTAGYCGSVAGYLRRKGMRLQPAAWFWLALVLLTGASYALWGNNGLRPWRDLFLFCGAVYWVIVATGLPVLGRTSDWLPLDGLNGLLAIPLRNFGCQYRSLGIWRKRKGGAGGQALSIVLGLLLALIVMAAVLPLLIQADSGGFARIADGIWRHFRRVQVTEFLVQGLLAIPTAAYLFGLVAGCVHRRHGSVIKLDLAQKTLDSLRILPAVSVLTALGLLCGLYLVFIGSQLPYFFSAFAGQRPEGWQIYSEYARNGFFELCRIAVINLVVLTAANLSGERSGRNNWVLRALNCLLALLTLLLIATAGSKMLLYIKVYGLSIRRLLPCLFMAFLAVICGGVIVLQKRRFSIMRLAAGTGAVLLCALCLLNPDGLVARYNADRYLAGSLSGFDVEILYQAGPAGVEAALTVYDRTDDAAVRTALAGYLRDVQYAVDRSAGKPDDTVQNARARRQLAQLP